jgi:UDP-glucose 4-epimerase
MERYEAERKVKCVLITGVAGLMGSRLADWICENTHATVIGIDDLSGGFEENVHPGVIFQQIDAASNDLEAWFRLYKPDVVYHFAAYAAECLSPFIRKYNYQNNLIATANVVNLCIKYNVGRLVFTSSMAVYGHGSPPFDEERIPYPVDPYGVAKYACELDIRIAGKQHGLDWCILRPHNVYGVKQNIWDAYRNVIGIFMYKVMNDDYITIFGDGLQRRAFSFIDDTLEPMWRAGWEPKARCEVINLGGIHSNTILGIAECVASTAVDLGIVKEKPKIMHLPKRHEVYYAFSTYDKSVNILGFEHKTDIEKGIREMWEWAVKQPKRPRFVWKHHELDEGLYPYWTSEALRDGFWKERQERIEGEDLQAQMEREAREAQKEKISEVLSDMTDHKDTLDPVPVSPPLNQPLRTIDEVLPAMDEEAVEDIIGVKPKDLSKIKRHNKEVL